MFLRNVFRERKTLLVALDCINVLFKCFTSNINAPDENSPREIQRYIYLSTTLYNAKPFNCLSQSVMNQLRFDLNW